MQITVPVSYRTQTLRGNGVFRPAVCLILRIRKPKRV